MIVIDASAFLELLLRTETGHAVERVLMSEEASTPQLFDAEVLNRIASFHKSGVLDPNEADTAVQDLRDAPIIRYDHRPLLGLAFEISSALSGYDSLYAALAAELDGVLVTGDQRLASTARDQFQLNVADL